MIARTHPEVPPVVVALGADAEAELDALPTGLVLLELMSPTGRVVSLSTQSVRQMKELTGS
jgi:hypothetical protein